MVRATASTLALGLLLATSSLVSTLVSRRAFAGPASAAPADSPTARAMDLFSRGAESYRAGRFQEAIDLLKQAYELKAEPIVLYNIARAYEGLGQSPEAIKAYSDFLKAQPSTPDRGAIEARMTALQAQIDKDASLQRERDEAERKAKEAEQRATLPGPVPDSARSGASAWPWILAGVGAASLGAGGVFGGLSLARHSTAVSAPQTQISQDESAASSFATAANVCFIAGGALAAAGVLWGVLDLRASHKTIAGGASARLVLGPGWAGVDVRTP